MRVLGVDFGEKRIGLALSDPLGFTAQGLETAENRGKARFVEHLKDLCAKNGVSEVVVGLPVNMDGSIGPKAKEVLALVELLAKELALPVKTWDERLSSRQVNRIMIEGGLSRRRQKENSDRLAAVLILQSYLESIRR
jgi:putative holliday junction resolvase